MSIYNTTKLALSGTTIPKLNIVPSCITLMGNALQREKLQERHRLTLDNDVL